MIFSELVLTRARTLLDKNRITPDPEARAWSTWHVHSSSGQVLYRVQLDYSPAGGSFTWSSCSCPFGSKRITQRVNCSHVCGVLMLLKRQRGAS